MGRRVEKVDYVSVDTLRRLRVFCNGSLNELFLANIEFRGLGIQTFYEIMRGGYGTQLNIKRFEDLDKRLTEDGTYTSLSACFNPKENQ